MRQHINVEDLKFSEKEKAELGDLADEVVQEILESLSPMQQFFLYMGIIYGTKIMYANKQPLTPKKKIVVEK